MCLWCGKKNHKKLFECWDFKNLEKRNRNNFVREFSLCWKCFKPGSKVANCPNKNISICKNCDKNDLLCRCEYIEKKIVAASLGHNRVSSSCKIEREWGVRLPILLI